MKVFTLPDLGEGTVEAEIVAWHVKPGDRDSEQGKTEEGQTGARERAGHDEAIPAPDDRVKHNLQLGYPCWTSFQGRLRYCMIFDHSGRLPQKSGNSITSL